VTFSPSIPFSYKELAPEARIVCSCCGRDYGRLDEGINHQLNSHIFPTKQFQDAKEEMVKLGGGSRSAAIEVTLINKAVLFRDLKYKIDKIIYDIRMEHRVAPLEVKFYEQTNLQGNSQLLQHASTVFGSKRIEMVFANSTEQKRVNVSFSVTDEPKKGCCS
jgi:hypothetical protein